MKETDLIFVPTLYMNALPILKKLPKLSTPENTMKLLKHNTTNYRLVRFCSAFGSSVTRSSRRLVSRGDASINSCRDKVGVRARAADLVRASWFAAHLRHRSPHRTARRTRQTMMTAWLSRSTSLPRRRRLWHISFLRSTEHFWQQKTRQISRKTYISSYINYFGRPTLIQY